MFLDQKFLTDSKKKQDLGKKSYFTKGEPSRKGNQFLKGGTKKSMHTMQIQDCAWVNRFGHLMR